MEVKPDDHPIPEPSGGLNGTPSSRYVQRATNRPTNLRPTTFPTPTIDLGLLLNSPSETAKFDSALRNHGLFHAVNHGIPTPLLDRLLSATREFFSSAPPQQQGEGYGQDAVVDDDQILDWSYRLAFVLQPEKERKVDLCPPLLKDVLLEYHEECKVVAKKVLMAMGEALGLGSNYFEEVLGEKGRVGLRINHYPRCDRPDLVMGLKAHRDVSAITLVLQDPEADGGLQVLAGCGEWLEVPVLPGALLFNVGDLIEIMSNGIYRSPFHRVVVTGAERERVSVVLFYNDETEKEIGPAKALVGDGKPKMYKDVIVKDYHDAFWSAFPMGKTVIETVKIG